MSSPFEIADGDYFALVNADGQHSLWPASIPVPAGWQAGYGPASRGACLAYVTEQWKDMRPRGLREQMGAAL